MVLRRIVLREMSRLSGQRRKMLFLSTLRWLYRAHRRPQGSTCPLDFLQKGDLFIGRSAYFIYDVFYMLFFSFFFLSLSPFLYFEKQRKLQSRTKRELVGINNVFNNIVQNAHGKINERMNACADTPTLSRCVVDNKSHRLVDWKSRKRRKRMHEFFSSFLSIDPKEIISNSFTSMGQTFTSPLITPRYAITI